MKSLHLKLSPNIKKDNLGVNMKNSVKKTISQYLQTLAGVMITAFAISVFYTPNKIVNGGVSGMSTVLFHVFSIPPGLSFAIINIIFLLLAFRLLGKDFVIKTIIGAGLTSLFVQLFTYLPPFSGNIILATIFGAILYGFGIGITLINGASTGGTDILGRLLQHFFPHMHIGRLLLIVDATVISISLLVFRDVELALWGVVSLFVSTFAIDWLIKRLNISKLAFIVSNKGEEIAEMLIKTSPGGVTIIESKGAYNKQHNKVLMCALKEKEIPEFQKKVTEYDKDSFIIYSEAQSIVGNGFYVYK